MMPIKAKECISVYDACEGKGIEPLSVVGGGGHLNSGLSANRTHDCRLHDKDKRLSVGIIDCILTKGLSTISEGIPKG
jgi:hypothetical protein